MGEQQEGCLVEWQFVWPGQSLGGVFESTMRAAMCNETMYKKRFEFCSRLCETTSRPTRSLQGSSGRQGVTGPNLWSDAELNHCPRPQSLLGLLILPDDQREILRQ